MKCCGRYLLNAYQTCFGLVVCVLEALPKHPSTPQALSRVTMQRDFAAGSTRVAWKQPQNGEGTHDARCITFTMMRDVTWSCLHCSAHCRLQSNVGGQAQHFIHEFAKFLTTFGGSGGLEDSKDRHRLAGGRSWMQPYTDSAYIHIHLYNDVLCDFRRYMDMYICVLYCELSLYHVYMYICAILCNDIMICCKHIETIFGHVFVELNPPRRGLFYLFQARVPSCSSCMASMTNVGDEAVFNVNHSSLF